MAYLHVDHYYVFRATTSGAEAPLDWVNNAHYYLPFDIPPTADSGQLSDNATITSYSAVTSGFSVDLDCHDAVTDDNYVADLALPEVGMVK